MKLPQPLIEAVIKERLSRFTCLIEVRGRESEAYLPNSGRLPQLIKPGSRVYVRAKSDGKPFELILAEADKGFASLDARLPSRLFAEALEGGLIEFFSGYTYRREIKLGRRRIDFLLKGASLYYFEVKSVTLVRDGVALFPDAPTLRGRGHLLELMRASEEGFKAGIAFIVQREDAFYFAPNRDVDPHFSDFLQRASERGIKVLAFSCSVSLNEIFIKSQIPVIL